MSSLIKNLSSYDESSIPDMSEFTFGIVVSEWHSDITGALLEGVLSTLKKHGVEEEQIAIQTVPGSFELTLGAARLCDIEEIDAVIALGCVIQGETRHFDFICQAVANGLTELNIEYMKPVIFGVLTPDTLEQAQARAGGAMGNKGVEAAITAIKMLLN